ncbi:procollagen C-endopeptidase enhancer 2-like isoform X2 [Mercenaria mercenaria]|uniref:procollagen C-endopeptidase enhancer 2-like isoform X2 n=1 Tax=Mercenaria mercenaria TaxID=6596 RepID=UPI00234E5AB6|nr:procollagen C-endopeptidase enhancer 2-like isoform X2 [Mercenaria mercenaria]
MCLKFEMAIIYSCLTVLIFWTWPVSGQDFTNCGGELSASSERNGAVISPNFVDNLRDVYPHYANCTWKIRCGTSKQVVINFGIFALERDTNCDSFDWVTVDNGEVIKNGDLGRFCGDTFCRGYQEGFFPFNEIVSNGTVVTINFRSDSSVTSAGFKFTYTCTITRRYMKIEMTTISR